jgi:hypothetical protein
VKHLLVAVVLAASAPVAAASDAAALFAHGNFPAAIAAGTAENTAASLVIAGRARLQVASYSVTDKHQAKAMIAAAQGDFDAALAKTPNDENAQLNLAIAQGYTAKLDHSPTGAKAMRKSLDAILTRDPNNAQAWAALGGWNGGAVATVGSFIAGSVLGANKAAMTQAFTKAMALDPANPINPIFYAMTLLDIDTGNAAQAKALLTRAATLPSRDACEMTVAAGGAKTLAALTTGDAKSAQALARRAMPFGTVK